MAYRVRTVDVFTQRQLAGNQLAVVLDADELSAEVMQAIAREMNLAETTFVMTPQQDGAAARIRIFTPSTELPFAGHPTIGTAWVIRDEGLIPAGAESLVLEEGIGPVPVRVDAQADPAVLWMTHPEVSFGAVFEDRTALVQALGLAPSDLAEGIPMQVASTGNPFLFVALREPQAVDAAQCDAAALRRAFAGHDAEAVFIFAPAGPGRLYSRMFAPLTLGIWEDPATGSASGPLGAFAVRYGLIARAAEVSIVSEQGTRMGRQSFVHIRLIYADLADDPNRIEVGGSVVPVMTAELAVTDDPDSTITS